MESKRIKADKLIAQLITVVGIITGSFVCLILGYLAFVAFPLLSNGDVFDPKIDLALSSHGHVVVSSKNEHISHIDMLGNVQVVELQSGDVVYSNKINWPQDFQPTHLLSGLGEYNQYFLLFNQRELLLVEADFKFSYPNFAAGDYSEYSVEPVFNFDTIIAYQENGEFDIATASFQGDRLSLLLASKYNNQGKLLFINAQQIGDSLSILLPENLIFSSISKDRALFFVTEDGGVINYDIPVFNDGQSILEPSSFIKSELAGDITAVTLNQGKKSLLIGDSTGALHLYGLVDQTGGETLALLRIYQSSDEAIVYIAPEVGKKGMLTIDAVNVGRGYFQTIENINYQFDLGFMPTHHAVAKNSEQWFFADASNQWKWLQVHDEFAEFSFATLFQKVWYEGYNQPSYLWQSTAAVADFEPKLSLIPMIVGTLKGALYAMLFSLPLALFGACYTARFMQPVAREFIKPAIEIIGSFPTVIIGFIAALWLAPLIEEELISLFLMFLLLPVLLIVCSYLVGHLKISTDPKFVGWEFVSLIPAVILAVIISWSLGSYIEMELLQMPTIHWLEENWGIDYQQRNGLIVGVVMGIAVIPLVYSISEDAFYAVPESLVKGAIALGARPWQVVTTIIFPAAMPGLFSATMIGFGRAVGETMIVMMAAGNTAITDWSFWTGMRTLSANIAVEMPEAEIGSTHYRILFVSALLLLSFTFLINTVAEIVRQRLRKQYSGL